MQTSNSTPVVIPKLKRVLIVGGGLAGLALAQLIQKHRQLSGENIEVVVLERDDNENAREQGFDHLALFFVENYLQCLQLLYWIK